MPGRFYSQPCPTKRCALTSKAAQDIPIKGAYMNKANLNSNSATPEYYSFSILSELEPLEAAYEANFVAPSLRLISQTEYKARELLISRG
jgi:hypothetical protein